MKKIPFIFSIVILCSVFCGSAAFAQRRVRGESSRERPTLTYDLGGGAGSYNGYSYSEINLGLNYYVQNWLNWRNAVFTRFGDQMDTVTGLDTALLLTGDTYTEGGGLGIQGFIGPGFRFANQNNSGAFGQAGVILALGGLRLGIGAKSIYYTSNRQDPQGRDLPKNDVQYFLILGGGGVL